jgi:aminopeptidase N
VSFVWFVGSSSVQAQAPTEPFRAAGDRPIDIKHIRLDLKVDLPKKTIDARATLSVKSLRPLSGVSLDAVDFEVQHVHIDKDEIRFSHDGKKLAIDLEPSWDVGREALLVIDYRIREPKSGLHFFAPTEAEPEVPLTVWSQGEPITNRYWIPCLDHPNQRQTSEMFVTVAEGFEVLSNGKLVDQKPNPDKTVTFHWKQDRPHVSYLITLVVGKFDVIREEWKGVPVLYYVPRGHKDEVGITFGRTREMLDFFSRRFGIDYPWEKYAQVVVEQFNAGGMENTSATTLHDRVLHDERSMLDSSPDALISHELAHQWWGDLVTCRDWAHIWLNEGFATYAEALWDEHNLGADKYAYTMLLKGRQAIAGGRDRPIVDRRYSAPFAMFDARAYPKGGYVLHMLRRKLGEDVFWHCIQAYGKEHRHQSVETADFRKTLERETGRSLERFFYDWTERAGSPTLEVSTEYQPESKVARVAVKQTQPGEAFALPVNIIFTVPNSKPVSLSQELTEKEHVFFVPLPGRPSRVDVDPQQALLADITEHKSHELWLTQLHEADVAGRVRAAQHFAGTRTPADREALIKALGEEKFWGVRVEIATALGGLGGDEVRGALVQGLKDTDARVRRACVEQLGKFHRDATAATAVKEVLQKGDAAYGVEAAALRAYPKLQQTDTVSVLLPWLAKASHNETLRESALAGLGESQDLTALDTLVTWTKRGKPRNCRVAALNGLLRLTQTANPAEEQQQRIVTAVAACLEGETSPVRRVAVTVLRELGKSASPTLVTLEALQVHDPEDGIRELAKRAIEQIRNNATVPVELTRLREELDRLKRTQEKLQERVEKYEKLEKKGG